MKIDIHEMTSAYLEAVAFTDFGEDGQPSKDADFSDAANLDAQNDCSQFLEIVANHGLLDEYIEKGGNSETLGHDFWFTRNHHGVGFWDRGLGGLGEQLTHHAQKFADLCAYSGDDGLVYFG